MLFVERYGWIWLGDLEIDHFHKRRKLVGPK
jgi:hypothetical protein